MIILKNNIDYYRAKKLIIELNHFIELVDDYETTNDYKWIIKSYAMSNSIAGVIKNSRLHNKNNINKEAIIKVLNDKPIDELHTKVKKLYKSKFTKRKNEF